MQCYAVFGHPISHSRSPDIHQAFARELNLSIEYQALDAPLDGFRQQVTKFFAQGGKGCNVTLPFKEQALEMADSASRRAQLAGAANTLWIKEGELYAENTDGIGLVSDLLAHQIEMKDKRILLLGAGGASKGVLLPLLEQAPKELVIANRTVSKAQAMVDKCAGQNVAATGLEQLGEQVYDLVVNGSSASLQGEVPAISPEIIGSDTVCYDMMYGSTTTVFNQWALKQGALTTLDGLGMLVEQAAESFRLWTGYRPDSRKVIEVLRKGL